MAIKLTKSPAPTRTTKATSPVKLTHTPQPTRRAAPTAPPDRSDGGSLPPGAQASITHRAASGKFKRRPKG